jgi:hypothetical protein
MRPCAYKPARFLYPPLNRINKSARRDAEKMKLIADEWPKLLTMIDDLVELFDDMAVVEFVPLYESVMRLCRCGLTFDSRFLQWIGDLHDSMLCTDEDGDADTAVDDFPCDDEPSLDCCEAGDDGGTGGACRRLRFCARDNITARLRAVGATQIAQKLFMTGRPVPVVSWDVEDGRHDPDASDDIDSGL